MILYMAEPPRHPNMSLKRHLPHPQRNPINSSSPPPTVTREQTLPARKRAKKTTKMSSAFSSGGPTSGRHPIYRGIRIRNGNWVSEIREPRKTTRIWLGTYPFPEMAAAAHDVATLALRGSEVALNFPDHVCSFPIPYSSPPQDIRRAAAGGAELMRPSEAVKNDGAVVGNLAVMNKYIDEEELFYMPNLLVDMAEGLLVSPPRIEAPPLEQFPGTSNGDSLWLWSYI